MKITELPQAASVATDDIVAIVQGGVTKKAPVEQVRGVQVDGVSLVDNELQLKSGDTVVGEPVEIPIPSLDGEMSDTSENGVKNKVVKQYIDNVSTTHIFDLPDLIINHPEVVFITTNSDDSSGQVVLTIITDKADGSATYFKGFEDIYNHLAYNLAINSNISLSNPVISVPHDDVRVDTFPLIDLLNRSVVSGELSAASVTMGGGIGEFSTTSDSYGAVLLSIEMIGESAAGYAGEIAAILGMSKFSFTVTKSHINQQVYNSTEE